MSGETVGAICPFLSCVPRTLSSSRQPYFSFHEEATGTLLGFPPFSPPLMGAGSKNARSRQQESSHFHKDDDEKRGILLTHIRRN